MDAGEQSGARARRAGSSDEQQIEMFAIERAQGGVAIGEVAAGMPGGPHRRERGRGYRRILTDEGDAAGRAAIHDSNISSDTGRPTPTSASVSEALARKAMGEGLERVKGIEPSS